MASNFLTTKELLDWEPPQREYIIPDGILWPGSRLIIFGRWGTWKSMLAMHTGIVLATGSNWFGYQTRKVSVAMAQVEMTQRQVQDRVKKYVKYNINPSAEALWWYNPESMKLDNIIQYKSLELELMKRKVDVLITDPIYRTMTGDITKPVETSRWLDNMDALRNKGIATIIIGHPRKLSADSDKGSIDWGQELFGSIYFENWADAIVYVHLEDDADIRLEFVKQPRDAEMAIPDIKIHIDRGTLSFKRTNEVLSVRGISET